MRHVKKMPRVIKLIRQIEACSQFASAGVTDKMSTHNMTDEVEVVPEMAAWHIPCYATYNCPQDTGGTKGGDRGKTNYQSASFSPHDWNLDTAQDWATFVFLWGVVVVTLAGVCLVVGSMFVRECRVSQTLGA